MCGGWRHDADQLLIRRLIDEAKKLKYDLESERRCNASLREERRLEMDEQKTNTIPSENTEIASAPLEEGKERKRREDELYLAQRRLADMLWQKKNIEHEISLAHSAVNVAFAKLGAFNEAHPVKR